jgi:hypothetical protein
MVRKIKPNWNWSGQYPAVDHEVEGQEDLDIIEIYKLLSLGDGSHLDHQNDPIFKISDALRMYYNQAYDTFGPSFAERKALLEEIQKSANALSKMFRNTGQESFFDLERSICRGLGQEFSEEVFDDKDPSPEVHLFREFSSDYIHKFARLIDMAAKEFPNDPEAPLKGRPAKTALVNLIKELAMIYEDHTGQAAYEGFTHVSPKEGYDNAFFRFAWAIVVKFDPEQAGTNAAFGWQIRNALSQPEQPLEFVHIQLEDGEVFDTGKKS